MFLGQFEQPAPGTTETVTTTFVAEPMPTLEDYLNLGLDLATALQRMTRDQAAAAVPTPVVSRPPAPLPWWLVPLGLSALGLVVLLTVVRP